MNTMRDFRRALRSAVGRPLAFQIRDGLGAAISGQLERVMRGFRVSDEEISELFASDDLLVMSSDGTEAKNVSISAGPVIIPTGKNAKATAIVPCHGVMLYDVEYQPCCFSTLLLAQTITSLANDPNIGAIILDINSPGGSVTGTAEAGDAIFAARGEKPVVALVNPQCASGGYWLASQCTEIVSIPSGDIGSVGVFCAHTDCSGAMEQAGLKTTFIFAGQYKVEGNPYEPLTAEAQAYYQLETDTIYADFLAAIARGRGIDAATVEANFGQGRTMMAPAAKKVGMIDRIAPIDLALGKYGVVMADNNQSRRRSEDSTIETVAESVLGAETSQTSRNITNDARRLALLIAS